MKSSEYFFKRFDANSAALKKIEKCLQSVSRPDYLFFQFGVPDFFKYPTVLFLTPNSRNFFAGSPESSPFIV